MIGIMRGDDLGHGAKTPYSLKGGLDPSDPLPPERGT